jgi:hypothetical protein
METSTVYTPAYPADAGDIATVVFPASCTNDLCYYLYRRIAFPVCPVFARLSPVPTQVDIRACAYDPDPVVWSSHHSF